MPQQQITVAMLAAPAVSASTLYGFYDALAGTRRDWQALHGGVPADSPFRPVVVSRNGRPLQAGNGVWLAPEASFADLPRPDVVCAGPPTA